MITDLTDFSVHFTKIANVKKVGDGEKIVILTEEKLSPKLCGFFFRVATESENFGNCMKFKEENGKTEYIM